ncbi:unnamed protein product [Durusdinium trenchii]|uniref:RING-type E3 ubiquitin transferase n=1 Tax=Durusdinium trenchii TaxID=1381693 RepID=A0ABP0RMG2_9DINO
MSHFGVPMDPNWTGAAPWSSWTPPPPPLDLFAPPLTATAFVPPAFAEASGVAGTPPAPPPPTPMPSSTEATAPSKGECIICMDAAPTHAIVPCGHKVLCVTCTRAFHRKPSSQRVCPLCRGPIGGIFQIFAAAESDPPATPPPSTEAPKPRMPETPQTWAGNHPCSSDPSQSGDAPWRQWTPSAPSLRLTPAPSWRAPEIPLLDPLISTWSAPSTGEAWESWHTPTTSEAAWSPAFRPSPTRSPGIMPPTPPTPPSLSAPLTPFLTSGPMPATPPLPGSPGTPNDWVRGTLTPGDVDTGTLSPFPPGDTGSHSPFPPAVVVPDDYEEDSSWEAKLQQLCEMGFEDLQSRQALLSAEGEMERAVAILISQSELPSRPPPSPPSPSPPPRPPRSPLRSPPRRNRSRSRRRNRSRSRREEWRRRERRSDSRDSRHRSDWRR